MLAPIHYIIYFSLSWTNDQGSKHGGSLLWWCQHSDGSSASVNLWSPGKGPTRYFRGSIFRKYNHQEEKKRKHLPKSPWTISVGAMRIRTQLSDPSTNDKPSNSSRCYSWWTGSVVLLASTFRDLLTAWHSSIKLASCLMERIWTTPSLSISVSGSWAMIWVMNASNGSQRVSTSSGDSDRLDSTKSFILAIMCNLSSLERSPWTLWDWEEPLETQYKLNLSNSSRRLGHSRWSHNWVLSNLRMRSAGWVGTSNGLINNWGSLDTSTSWTWSGCTMRRKNNQKTKGNDQGVKQRARGKAAEH